MSPLSDMFKRETRLILQVLKGYRRLAPVKDVRLPITPNTAPINHVFWNYAFINLPNVSNVCFSLFCFLCIGELTVSTKVHAKLIDVTQLDRLVNNQGRVQALQLTLHNYNYYTHTEIYAPRSIEIKIVSSH